MRSVESAIDAVAPARPRLLRRHLGRFLIVGVACVALDLTIYLSLMGLGCGRYPAKAGGFIAGMILGFILNKTWTFRSHRAAGGEAATYIALYAFSLLANVGLNGAILKYGASMFGHATTPAAFIIATGVCTVLNFLGMRFITFRRGIAAEHSSLAS